MMSLSDREYKAFVIGDVFQVSTGSLLPKGELKNGQIPRITASEANNGVIGTFAHSDHKNYRSLTNFISVSFLGGVFYHPYTASLDMKIHAVQVPEVELSKPLGAFLVSVLKQAVSSFSYGDQLSSTDLPKKKILLPVDSSGSPDWQFMTDYMKAHEYKLISRYEKYIQQFELIQGEKVNNLAWSEFYLKDIFNIRSTSSSIDRNKLTGKSGQVPYITRTDTDNGLDSLISDQPKYKLDDGNVITIGLDTQTAFYQPEAFYTGQNIQILSSEHINRYTALFIIPRLKDLMKKFNWGGNGATLTRLKRSMILLPITDSGEPDYKFMEDYIKGIEVKQLTSYVSYLTQNLA